MSPRKSNRRAFLSGKSAVDALEDVADHITFDTDVEGVPAKPQAGTAAYLVKVGRRAMACEFEVLLNAAQNPRGTEAAVAALDLVDELESQLTVYRDASEINRLNQTAHIRPVEVEPRLFDLLAKAAEIHRETAGAYDITSGPLSKSWGFYRRAGEMPSDSQLADAMRTVGMQHLQIDQENKTVRFDTPGVELNLGSIGKGYALDRAAEVLLAAGVNDFLLHGGNSSVLAHGSRGTHQQIDSTPVDNDGWWVGLRHPLLPRRRIGEVRLRNRALGTSGSGTQFFIHEGRRYGHILDPRKGRPTEGTLSTTVVAPTGAEADALATAFYVLGADASVQYCRQHPGLSAVIMSPIAGSSRAELLLFGFPEDDVRIYDDDSVSVRRIEA